MAKKQSFVAEQPFTKTFRTVKGQIFTRKLYNFDIAYSKETQCVIWSHGRSNYNIWFLNSGNKLCRIKSAELYHGNVYLTVTIDCKEGGLQKDTKMSLDRFLYLYEIGDFKITFKKFVETYLKPLDSVFNQPAPVEG